MTARDYDPEIKLLEMPVRRPRVATNLFHYHWHTIHGPLARGTPLLKRYVQHHRLYEPVRGFRALGCNGIMEGWFGDTASIAAIAGDPGFDAARLHVPIQASAERARTMVARSRTFRDQADTEAAASLVLGIVRRPDVHPTAFDELWQEHADLCLSVPTVRRYCQNDVVANLTKDGFAAVSVMTFVDVFALEEAIAEVGDRLIAHLARFAVPSASAAQVTHQHRIV